MSKEAGKKIIYGVFIYRRDNRHIGMIETEDFDKCVELWKELNEQWTSCGKEQKPFVIEDPVVTSFDPGLIYEISIIPIMPEEMSSKSHNPYQKQMMDQGFGTVMQPHAATGGHDLLQHSGPNRY